MKPDSEGKGSLADGVLPGGEDGDEGGDADEFTTWKDVYMNDNVGLTCTEKWELAVRETPFQAPRYASC